jgi:hypothetical protein
VPRNTLPNAGCTPCCQNCHIDGRGQAPLSGAISRRFLAARLMGNFDLNERMLATRLHAGRLRANAPFASSRSGPLIAYLLLTNHLLPRSGVMRGECSVHREKALDPVVAGVSTFGPIILRLFRDKRKLCNSLDILQTDFYRHEQTKRRTMVHG